MKSRITVLMSVYNCEDTLAEAIESLYNQTYKKFKLVLCDDGSTDNTFGIAKHFSEKYENIVLIKNEQNLKLAASLNRCLEYADTEYIARMDGDDISLSERFKKEIEFLDQHPQYAAVSCPMIYFDESGDWGKGKVVEKPTKENFKYGTPHPHAPCMIRTSVMKEVNGYTDTKHTIRVEDYYLWYKIYKAGYKGYNLQEPLYKMRDGKNAMSRRTFQNRWNAFIIKKEVLNGLEVPNSLFYAIPSFLKVFIPDFLMKIIRKKRMTNN